MTLTDIIETGCAAIMADADGMEQPCGGPVVAVRRWTGCRDGDGIGGVCAKHAAEPGAELVPLKDIPDRPALPLPLTYEDIEDGDPFDQPRVGDYGWAVRENAHSQDETPFHIERDEGHRPADGIAGHPAVREAGGRRGRRAVCEPAPAAPRRLHPEQDRAEDGRR